MCTILGSCAGSGSKVERVSMLRANALADEIDSEDVIKGELEVEWRLVLL